jgi:hypothetical protein
MQHPQMKLYGSNRNLVLAGIFCAFILGLLILFWWSTKTPFVPEKVMSMSSQNATVRTGLTESQQGIAVDKEAAKNQVLKFSSLEDLLEKEEKIPWDWSKGMSNAEELKHASERALAGDNRWARIMATMARPPYANKDDWYQEGKFGRKFPSNVSDNRLDWQKIAADRGDVHSQIGYWQTVSAIQLITDKKNIPSQEVTQLQANARQYMQAAMDNGVADAYSYAAAAYRDGKMGLQQNAIKAHACLIMLERQYSTEETKQLLEYSASRLRTGELSEAEAFANDPASCRIN